MQPNIDADQGGDQRRVIASFFQPLFLENGALTLGFDCSI
jgi:hypothetical protein